MTGRKPFLRSEFALEAVTEAGRYSACDVCGVMPKTTASTDAASSSRSENGERYNFKIRTVTLRVAQSITQNAVVCAEEAVALFRAVYEALDADQEHFAVLALDCKGHVIGQKVMFSGGKDASVVDPKIVWRTCIGLGASRVIFCHNHPSGDPSPSLYDDSCTRKLVDGGELIGIRVEDHVVLGDGTDKFFSYNRAGKLRP